MAHPRGAGHQLHTPTFSMLFGGSLEASRILGDVAALV